MAGLKNSYSLSDFIAGRQTELSLHKKYLLVFCAFVLLMAVLELSQDYISSVLNGNVFQLAESMSYKLFWLLFIPISIIQVNVLKKSGKRFSGSLYFILNTLIIPLITLAHLFIFSLFLFGISGLIHENPWSLPFLIAEKLSTRLYIGLAIYIVSPAVYFLFIRRAPGKERNRHNHSDTIPVKNGQNTVLVDVDHINWIRSDGPYLYIHTSDKKHVVLDSLKNIITTLPENFKRIHRSIIVNIDTVKELKSRGNGDYDLITDDGRMLRLSRNYAKPLKGTLL